MQAHSKKHTGFNQQSAENFHNFKPQHWKNFLKTNSNTILMVPPKGLTISEDPNNEKEEKYLNFFEKDPEQFRKTAYQQWNKLKELYVSWDVNISSQKHTIGLNDQVYTADPAFTLIDEGNKTVTILKSHFTNATRQPEVVHFINLVEKANKAFIGKGYAINEYQMHHNFEGTGDCYYDEYRDMIFAGYTTNPDRNDPTKGRSSIEAHEELQEQTGIDTISLEVVKPCFHIDTCLAPLPSGHMLIYKEGMTEESYEHLIQRAFIDKGLNPDEYLIPVSKNDAENNFVTNIQCVGNKIAMPQFEDKIDGEIIDPIDPALLKRLDDIGYNVTVLNYSHMIMAGGAMHCTSHLLQNRIKGGRIAQMIKGLNAVKNDPAPQNTEHVLQPL